MQIKGFGVTLRRLTQKDLSQVREWRNADHVRQNMEYRDFIDADAHQAWFDGLHSQNDLYFVLHCTLGEIGVLNLKNIDWNEGTAEAGIFIGEEEALQTTWPAQAVLLLMRCAFELWGLTRLQAKMHKGATKVIAFNHQLGYQIQGASAHPDFIQAQCTAQDFWKSSQPLLQVLEKMYAEFPQLAIEEEEAWILSRCRSETWQITKE